jgi:uncharacterized protein YdaU (DUF1376 family)
MAREKSPAFQFYPRDFMGDLNVQAMDWDERGVYFWLICLCWGEEEIPADLKTLSAILRIPQRRLAQMWERIGRCFTTSTTGKLRHPKLDSLRNEREGFLDKCSEAGKKSAQLRKERKERSTNVEPTLQGTLPKPCNQNPTLQSSSSPSGTTPSPAATDALVDEFHRWVAEYPNAVRVDTALRAWISLIDLGEITAENLFDVFAGLERWKQSAEWARDGGKYIPAPAVFLTGNERHTGRMWKDYPPASEEATVARRGAKRSSDGVDPNAIWIAPWKRDEVA